MDELTLCDHGKAVAIGDLRRPLRATNRTCKLLKVRVDDVEPNQLIKAVQDTIRHRSRLLILHANAHLVTTAQSRPWLISLFEQAGLVFCDGAGVQFAYWLKTGRKPSRHTAPEWIEQLALRLADEGRTIYWVGGKRDVVEIAARRLTERTSIRVAGVHHGFFDMRVGSTENEALVADIQRTKPDLLLVNMGMPLQERWLFDNWSRLNVPVAITAGALVDHLAGVVNRPPMWVANLGFEWLVRLALEPKRLWRRYVFGLPVFALRCLVSFAVDRAK